MKAITMLNKSCASYSQSATGQLWGYFRVITATLTRTLITCKRGWRWYIYFSQMSKCRNGEFKRYIIIITIAISCHLIDNALSNDTGALSHYVKSFKFKNIVVREMPLYICEQISSEFMNSELIKRHEYRCGISHVPFTSTAQTTSKHHPLRLSR